jgi:hypothetical protein
MDEEFNPLEYIKRLNDSGSEEDSGDDSDSGSEDEMSKEDKIFVKLIKPNNEDESDESDESDSDDDTRSLVDSDDDTQSLVDSDDDTQSLVDFEDEVGYKDISDNEKEISIVINRKDLVKENDVDTCIAGQEVVEEKKNMDVLGPKMNMDVLGPKMSLAPNGKEPDSFDGAKYSIVNAVIPNLEITGDINKDLVKSITESTEEFETRVKFTLVLLKSPYGLQMKKAIVIGRVWSLKALYGAVFTDEIEKEITRLQRIR